MKPVVRHAPDRARAFTLIEILMAVAIFGMVLMAIYATWTLILKSAKVGQDVAAQGQRERVAMRTIKEALGCVMSFQADPQNYSFLADNDSGGFLSFAARLPEMFPRSSRIAFDGFDVRRVSFSIENGADMQRQLVLRQTPLLKELNADEKDFPFVLAKGVEKMELQFWDQRKRDWIDDWTRTNELPKMIKIKLEFLRRNPNNPQAQPVKVEVIDVAPLPAIMVPTAAQGPPTGAAPPGFGGNNSGVNPPGVISAPPPNNSGEGPLPPSIGGRQRPNPGRSDFPRSP